MDYKPHEAKSPFGGFRGLPCIRFSNNAKKQAKTQGQNCNRNAKRRQTTPRYAKVKTGIGIMFLFAEKKKCMFLGRKERKCVLPKIKPLTN